MFALERRHGHVGGDLAEPERESSFESLGH
jgi:hypothetical protein